MRINLTAVFTGLVLVSAVAVFAAEGVRTDVSAKDLARVRSVTAPTKDFSKAEPFEAMSGGAATSTKLINRDAFSHFSANLSFAEQDKFNLGDGFFKKLWVAAPSSTLASDGLGPLFNARACQSCHLKDGRGHPPANNDVDGISMFLRLSVPPGDERERNLLATRELSVLPEPHYGSQLQDFANPGIPAEGKMHIDYEEVPVTLGDGTVVNLRKPRYSVTDLGYGPLDENVMLSPRVAPQMIGMGLLEAIPAEDIEALADPDDKNGDGISGKPSWVMDEGQLVLGRFGWKAAVPSVRDQSALAFAGDIGISTPDVMLPYGDCMESQTACRAAPNGIQSSQGDSEAPDPVLDLVAFYARNLAVPARRNVDDSQVLDGKKLFYETGCTSCHTPKFVTSRDAIGDAQKFQLIWPYTDMLLHDMGEGLADHRPEGDANGYEWRTAPLWGIGLTRDVSGHTLYLHDGRARNLLEAILWHGGEAQAQRDAVVQMRAEERQALLAFLESL